MTPGTSYSASFSVSGDYRILNSCPAGDEVKKVSSKLMRIHLSVLVSNVTLEQATQEDLLSRSNTYVNKFVSRRVIILGSPQLKGGGMLLNSCKLYCAHNYKWRRVSHHFFNRNSFAVLPLGHVNTI